MFRNRIKPLNFLLVYVQFFFLYFFFKEETIVLTPFSKLYDNSWRTDFVFFFLRNQKYYVHVKCIFNLKLSWRSLTVLILPLNCCKHWHGSLNKLHIIKLRLRFWIRKLWLRKRKTCVYIFACNPIVLVCVVVLC